MLIDYDNIDAWREGLAESLKPCLPSGFKQKIIAANPKYIEDASDFLFSLADRDQIIDRTLTWIGSETIVGYHGSRLTGDDISSMQSIGLMPLQADARRQRLVRALSSHPRWASVSGQLDSVIKSLGIDGKVGKREGQVHLTISRAGLIDMNHYLEFGSEFDYHAAHSLLGDEGQKLLTRDGEPTIIHLAVPGPIALKAAHPFFSDQDLRNRGDVPNIVGDLLSAWSFKLAKPNFNPRNLKTDCGMIFYNTVPPEWIIEVEQLIL